METARANRKFLGMERQAVFFLFLWLVLSVVQVSFTELTSDEGYYWFYSKHLQWGYYDHPPLVALMIKWGGYIFPAELGVRFFNVVFSTAGLYLFLSLLPPCLQRNNKTYFILLAAPLLHYLSFIVFPDGPLIFFTLLFLVLYKRFLVRNDFAGALLLGLALALMAYSKYHGILVLVFTVLANTKLLRSFNFYVALAVAAVLFSPHLWWQYQHDFPTLKYHLSGRTGTISLRHVGEYLSQQLVAIGPGMIFLPFVIKTKDVFERTLKFVITGSLLFFLLSSFKTFVHFHWTSIALYPLLYFAVFYYTNPNRGKLFNRLLIPFVVVFGIIRVLLIFPLIPAMHVGEDYYHGRQRWAKEVAATAGDDPVFIPNNLREASLYSFYSGRQGITLYNRPEKKSQYELWGYEDSLQGKNVFFLTKYPFGDSKPLQTSLDSHWNYSLLPDFRSYYTNVAMHARLLQQYPDSLQVIVTIVNERSVPLDLQKGLNGQPAALMYSLEQKGKEIKTGVLYTFGVSDNNIAHNNSIERKVTIAKKDIIPGSYQLYFGIRNGVLPDAVLSQAIDIQW